MNTNSSVPNLGQNLLNFVGRLSLNSIHRIYQTYCNVQPRITYEEISRRVNNLIGSNPIYLNDNIVNNLLVICLKQQKNYVKSTLYRENTPESAEFLNERFVSSMLNYLSDLQKGKDILAVKNDKIINDRTIEIVDPKTPEGKTIEINFGQPGVKKYETNEKIHIVFENPQDMLHKIHMNDPNHHKNNLEIMMKKYFDTNYPEIPYWSVNFRVYVDPAVREQDDKDRAEFEEWKKNRKFV